MEQSDGVFVGLCTITDDNGDTVGRNSDDEVGVCVLTAVSFSKVSERHPSLFSHPLAHCCVKKRTKIWMR